jgi:hypothetical protein
VGLTSGQIERIEHGLFAVKAREGERERERESNEA